MNNYEEVQSGIRSLELESSEQCDGVVPVEDEKSLDTETSAKKEKEDTNNVETEGEIEPPRRISEKVWKSYLGIRKFLKFAEPHDDDDDNGLPPLRPRFYGPKQRHDVVSDDEDSSMLESYDLDVSSGDDEPMPCLCPGGLPGLIPILKIKENTMNNSVLIDHLPEGTSAEDLLKLFSIYGHVTQILIPTDKTTGHLESFGLVFFRNIDDAEIALNSLNEKGHHVEWYVDAFDICFRTTSPLVLHYYCE